MKLDLDTVKAIIIGSLIMYAAASMADQPCSPNSLCHGTKVCAGYLNADAFYRPDGKTLVVTPEVFGTCVERDVSEQFDRVEKKEKADQAEIDEILSTFSFNKDTNE